jgi:hypothetical protein
MQRLANQKEGEITFEISKSGFVSNLMNNDEM